MKGTLMNKKANFFVIMPYGDERKNSKFSFNEIYDKLIYKAIDGLGQVCEKAASTLKSYDILKNELIDLRKMDNYVIADLTDCNPNVLYELGIRHAIVPNGTILIKQKKFKVPINITRRKIIEYDPYIADDDELNRRIIQLQKEILLWTKTPSIKEPDSPVYDLLEKYRNVMNELDAKNNENDKLLTQLENTVPSDAYDELNKIKKSLEKDIEKLQEENSYLKSKIENKLDALLEIKRTAQNILLMIKQNRKD